MSKANKYSGPTMVVVTEEAARQNPYPYVQVNDDGTVRELRAEERSFLETRFSPGDGGRPAVKESYRSKNGWGSVRGFCRRDKIPSDIEILSAEPKSPSISLEKSLQKQLDEIKKLGFQVTENPDGSITISKGD